MQSFEDVENTGLSIDGSIQTVEQDQNLGFEEDFCSEIVLAFTISMNHPNQETSAMPATDDILQRLRAGLPVSMDKLENPKILERVSHTRQLVVALNNSTDLDLARERLMEVIGTLVDASTFVMVPFYTNFGRHITLGRNIFINQNCTFLDLGGIIIEDDVIIGPRVKIISENYLAEDSQ